MYLVRKPQTSSTASQYTPDFPSSLDLNSRSLSLIFPIARLNTLAQLIVIIAFYPLPIAFYFVPIALYAFPILVHPDRLLSHKAFTVLLS